MRFKWPVIGLTLSVLSVSINIERASAVTPGQVTSSLRDKVTKARGVIRQRALNAKQFVERTALAAKHKLQRHAVTK